MGAISLRESHVLFAVQNIQRRAERELEPAKLHAIYVDSGVLQELSLDTNQVIHGRRGVGKTHLLHFYRDQLLSGSPTTLYQIHDCQRLGSGFCSEGAHPQAVATRAFNQLLNDIATTCFDDIERIESKDSFAGKRPVGPSVLAFCDTINKLGDGNSRFDFRNLGDTLDGYRSAANADRLVIALDEFVSIPRLAQPYFAEYLKRAFFTKPRISFKIAAVTYNTKTNLSTPGGVIGFEP